MVINCYDKSIDEWNCPHCYSQDGCYIVQDNVLKMISEK